MKLPSDKCQQTSLMISKWTWVSHVCLSWRLFLCVHCWNRWCYKAPGPWFNIKMPSYQYRKFHCGDKTVVRSSYLHNGISYTGKVASLYWINAQAIITLSADPDACVKFIYISSIKLSTTNRLKYFLGKKLPDWFTSQGWHWYSFIHQII